LPPIPEELSGQLALVRRTEEEAVWETSGELAPLLGWLSTLPLADVRIEPVGLRAIYDRFHAEQPLASGQRELADRPTLEQAPVLSGS
jgi:ABC-2 type transport system ATP-binding protein